MVSILLPLYIYPAAGSWEPLLSVAQSHPSISFTAVINPNNGPGAGTLPDANYIAALKSFKSYPNVHLIGYVCCRYGDRDANLIDQDVVIYSHWQDELALLGESGVSIDGIFFDEVPAELEYVELMYNVSSHVRNTWNNGLGKEATVIFNPGVIVDEAFYDQADLIVAFEESQANLVDFLDSTKELSAENRAKSAAIVHTYQGTVDELTTLVDGVKNAGLGGVFVTDQAGGLYNQWPRWWDSLVELLSISPSPVASPQKC
ncbi:hypothetical protein jhhlp_008875 [Lomentospora prolificans]|uniref:Spherulation-specific family 4 n=1 Tax=Lomentospora prolificans TaxID=41688 RepID=A0A2N3MZ91_9PEZI|nr:hypothetical protein jhhlp_008875 [Lomentospora prolificans]